jgi:serine phosphatase RsbU (regulator of sigma subunit)
MMITSAKPSSRSIGVRTLGDRLVLYTDGLTEAMNSDEHEFGEGRLLELCSSNITSSASELLTAIRVRRGVDS